MRHGESAQALPPLRPRRRRRPLGRPRRRSQISRRGPQQRHPADVGVVRRTPRRRAAATTPCTGRVLMKKIPTLFVRDDEDRRYVTEAVNSGCEWVLAGEGAATRKFDGTCVMLDEDGRWWARREVKPGKQAPANFVHVEHDETTGKTMGWEPV